MDWNTRGREYGWIAVVAIAFAILSVGCSGGGGGGSDVGWTFQDVDDHSSSDPDGTESDELVLDLGRRTMGGNGFEPYDDSNADVEIVHGFQGGYHIEPTLYLTGVDEEMFTADIHYEVVRDSDGEMLNSRKDYVVDHYGWMSYQDGFLHHSNPVIFAISGPSDVKGDGVEISITVDVRQGGAVSVTQDATIVDRDGR